MELVMRVWMMNDDQWPETMILTWHQCSTAPVSHHSTLSSLISTSSLIALISFLSNHWPFQWRHSEFHILYCWTVCACSRMISFKICSSSVPFLIYPETVVSNPDLGGPHKLVKMWRNSFIFIVVRDEVSISDHHNSCSTDDDSCRTLFEGRTHHNTRPRHTHIWRENKFIPVTVWTTIIIISPCGPQLWRHCASWSLEF